MIIRKHVLYYWLEGECIPVETDEHFFFKVVDQISQNHEITKEMEFGRLGYFYDDGEYIIQIGFIQEVEVDEKVWL